MSALSVPRFSVEEYLAADEASEFPLEYHDGEIFPINDVSFEHGVLVSNLHRRVSERLDGSGCRTVGTTRVRVSPTKYLQPDLLVYCGKPEFTNEKPPSLVNPKVIIEVLSPTTENYDSGRKRRLYQLLPSLEEYVLVAQDEPLIEVFRRSAKGHWTISEYQGEDATAELESLNIQLPLKDIYDQVPQAALEA
ncbi:MAG: Uma2 family endonuclease [Acidobacteria bacterium]|nr:Uma2 family endonuclease [Acidobacteriota bacterium]